MSEQKKGKNKKKGLSVNISVPKPRRTSESDHAARGNTQATQSPGPNNSGVPIPLAAAESIKRRHNSSPIGSVATLASPLRSLIVASPTTAAQNAGAPGGQSGPPVASAAGGKSKSQLKAERRALQEAQRALKSAGKMEAKKDVKKDQSNKKANEGPGPNKDSTNETPRLPSHVKVDDDKAMKRRAKLLGKQNIPQRVATERKLNLVSHLHQFDSDSSLMEGVPFSSKGQIHPAILTLGLQFSKGIICGSNARCTALLGAFRKLIADYSTPPHKDMARDLDTYIKPNINFLSQCRPLSVSMGNAIKFIKLNISQIASGTDDSEAKQSLFDSIDNFLKMNIVLAAEAISKYADSKIENGDVILIYACSSLILRVLSDSYKNKKKFRVIVVDSRPKLEGRETLKRLVAIGIECTYILINGLSYIMKEVTKVLLGAHALLANGYVMSRVGSSQIALVAKSFNVPTLICCETYKFCERVQTDSFVFNELGDPDKLADTSVRGDQPRNQQTLGAWRDLPSLSLLNLTYDVTPPDLVSLVITDLCMMPCTSVPVVLRVRNGENEL